MLILVIAVAIVIAVAVLFVMAQANASTGIVHERLEAERAIRDLQQQTVWAMFDAAAPSSTGTVVDSWAEEQGP